MIYVMLNVYICALRQMLARLLPEGTVKCTHLAPQENSQRTPTNIINKNGAIPKVRTLMEQVNAIKHLKRFSNFLKEYFMMKSQFYFLFYGDNIFIVCICIQRSFLIFTFMSKCFLKSLWQKESQVSFFRSNSLGTVKFLLTKLQVSWRPWF